MGFCFLSLKLKISYSFCSCSDCGFLRPCPLIPLPPWEEELASMQVWEQVSAEIRDLLSDPQVFSCWIASSNCCTATSELQGRGVSCTQFDEKALSSRKSRRLHLKKGDSDVRGPLCQDWKMLSRHVNWLLLIISSSKYLVTFSEGVDFLPDVIVILLFWGIRTSGRTWPQRKWFEHGCCMILETLHHLLHVWDLVTNHIKNRGKIHKANKSAYQSAHQEQFRAPSEHWPVLCKVKI